MEINTTELSPAEAYALMTHCVVPRPIAWVSTQQTSDGALNLAPFSYFGAITAKPPTLVISVGRRNGAMKDTAANLVATGEAVVHIVSNDLAERMVQTSAEVEEHINEFELAGLQTSTSKLVTVPRVAEAKIAMECKLASHMELGQATTDVFFLEVLHFYVADDIISNNKPDPQKLNAVGRLGGNSYSNTEQIFELERPS